MVGSDPQHSVRSVSWAKQKAVFKMQSVMRIDVFPSKHRLQNGSQHFETDCAELVTLVPYRSTLHLSEWMEMGEMRFCHRYPE